MITVARDLRAAGGAELFWRLSRRVATAVGRMRARFPPGALTDDAISASLISGPAGVSATSWAAHVSSSRRPFFFSPADRRRYHSILQRLPSDDRADRLRCGATLMYGRCTNIERPVDWHADPWTGARWPLVHWSEVPLATAPLADVRHVWELSRHTDLFVLGRAYWRTGDRSYADAAAARLVSWLDANPPEMGINWWSNLEVAMRAQAFVWALHFFADAFEPALLWRLTGAIIASARHIVTDLPFTRRTMPGNHVIGDAAGLATIALALPELREAATWRDRTIALLEAEAAAQVHADGTHTELSPAYHALVWELLFGVMTLAARCGIDMPNTRDALCRMARALVLVCTPDREVPPLGDSDEAVGWDLGDRRRRVGAIAALASVALRVAELDVVADDQAEEQFWLLGELPPRDLPPEGGSHQSEERESSASANLPQIAVTEFGISGRSSWSADADWWLLRHGGLSKHTHADALNLLMAVGGVACVIDAGTGSYNACSEFRRFFRGTSAHNTVAVDGLDQAELHRTFRWTTDLRSRGRVVTESHAAVFVSGDHDGYERVGVRHRRQVLWLREFGWIVVDRLSGTGRHAIQLRWLMPDEAVPAPSGARLTRPDGAAELALAAPWPVTAHRADDTPRAGWRSQHYGSRESALAVLTAGDAALPCTLVSILAPLRSPADRLAITALDRADDRATIRAAAGDRSIAITIGASDWSRLPE